MRFRISSAELTTLCQNGVLSQPILLPKRRVLDIRIIARKQPCSLLLYCSDDCVELRAQPDALRKLRLSLPSVEGLSAVQEVDEGKVLKLDLEVDIRTQK